MDLASAESKATYEEIKQYVAKNNDGMKMSNLYIAQVKVKHEIMERVNDNLPKSENARQPRCLRRRKRRLRMQRDIFR